MWLKASPGGTATVAVDRKRDLSPGDMRRACLFACWDLSAPYQEDLTLADCLARPHEVWAARRVTEDGTEFVYLDLAFPANRLRLWLDPAHNYLVWKAIAGKRGDPRPSQDRVTEFRRSADGAVLPVRVEHQWSLPGVAPVTLVSTLSDVRLNEPVPPEAFRIPGLAGLTCADSIRKETYQLDAKGDRIAPPPAGPEPGDDPPDLNARRVATYILCALAAAGLVVAVADYWRRMRAVRTVATDPALHPTRGGTPVKTGRRCCSRRGQVTWSFGLGGRTGAEVPADTDRAARLGDAAGPEHHGRDRRRVRGHPEAP